MAKRESKILVVLILVIALISVLVSFFNPVLNKTELRASFIFSKSPGMGDKPGEIFFGAINNDTTAIRKVLIKNYFDGDVLVNIKSRGEISDNLIVSDNNFLIPVNGSKEVSFTVFSKGLKDYKEYDGNIIIITKKV